MDMVELREGGHPFLINPQNIVAVIPHLVELTEAGELLPAMTTVFLFEAIEAAGKVPRNTIVLTKGYEEVVEILTAAGVKIWRLAVPK